jgi:hypothetical protein
MTGAALAGFECFYAASLENLDGFLDALIYLSGNGWSVGHAQFLILYFPAVFGNVTKVTS